jgi:hypothetical protein
MLRRKVSTTIYITPEQADRLKLLHERTKVPVAVYIREGIDLMLKHYEHVLPGQLSLDGSTPPPAPAGPAGPPASAMTTSRKEPAPEASAPRPTLRTGAAASHPAHEPDPTRSGEGGG